ncbi:alanine aminotransferase 1-like isoform 1-T1 [Synchiropus picturatus]
MASVTLPGRREVLDASSGDSHKAGMKPVTFIRQVLAACLHPELLNCNFLPADVADRAREFLEACDGGSVGSYTPSSGLTHVRRTIAEFITRRDGGVPSRGEDVFIASGRHRAMTVIFKLLSGAEGQTRTGVLVPSPGPHALPMLLDHTRVTLVPYQLREDRSWAVDLEELQRSLKAARGRCNPRAIFISNPGDPTGHVQEKRSIQEVIQFAFANRLLLLVDEVFQDNVFGAECEFVSYKRVLFEMGEEHRSTVEMVSFHGLAAPCLAECGLMAGYMEVVNMDPQVKMFVDTTLTADINAPVSGQLALDMMLNPPQPGEPSWPKYTQETLHVRTAISDNANRALEFLNGLPGVSCQPVSAGIFLYPRLRLPPETWDQVENSAASWYCRKLLEEESVLVGAGHEDLMGSFHLRLCILLPSETLEDVLTRLKSFHLRHFGRHEVRSTAPAAGGRGMSSALEVNPVVRRIRSQTGLKDRAAQLAQQVAQGVQKPFTRVIDISCGDSHQVGMSPTKLVRQVLAVCLHPDLLQDQSLPQDVRQRAQKLLAACGGGSVGSYSRTSRGIPQVHRSIAEFITRRDGGAPCSPDNIIFCCGSQRALLLFGHLMASGEGKTRTGMLTPSPCPHTLPMLLDECGLVMESYHLKEDNNWAIDLEELHRALKDSRGRSEPRAIYISNPGNPTGHVQVRETIEDVIRFAAAEQLVILAEEVYQDSVYGEDREFLSYRRVLLEMGAGYADTVEMVSFHSLSSACMQECGLRGAYMETINLDPSVHAFLQNMQATSSPAVLPQLAIDVMVTPPTPGEPSYENYSQEVEQTLTTLAENSRRACEQLNSIPGISCQSAEGGIFLFPRVQLPVSWINEAQICGLQPDQLYCQRFLEEEGVCLGAGSENNKGFHLRICILVPPPLLDEVLLRLQSFHHRILNL